MVYYQTIIINVQFTIKKNNSILVNNKNIQTRKLQI